MIGKRTSWCLLGQNSWWTGQGIALVAKGRLLTGKAGLSMTPSPLQRAYNAVYCHVYQRPLPSAYRCLYNTIYGSINQWPPKLPSLCMSASLLFRSLNDYHLFVLQSAIRIQHNFSAQSLPSSYNDMTCWHRTEQWNHLHFMFHPLPIKSANFKCW